MRLVLPFEGRASFVRSRANRIFGYGVTIYIVLLTTSGAASCPRLTPVEKVNSTRRLATLPPLI